uniref:PLAT domain-containing protein n=1 Tax=Macrostomum lignano TaxID=282301 RepID=A0A1I8FW75_9PLAT
RSRSCSSPAPQYGGRFCLPCTANLTYPESADNASVSLATVVKDYVSVEDNCSYKGNYYEVDGDLIIWDDDVQYANCSMEPCISTLADKANSFVDEFLKGLNNSGTNKSEMVNKITNLLADQLKNAEVGKPVMIDAKGVSVGVSKVNSSNMAGSEMKSGDKGGIVLGDAEDTGVEGQDASLKFSALDPKTFFPGADKKDQSAAVVSLNLAQGTEVVKPSNASKVSLTLSLPNQNQETTENLLQPVAMKRGKRMVQKFTFEAANTAIKASLELPSSDSYLMMFRGGVPANFSKQANFTAWVHSNETMKIETDGSLEVRLKFDTALAAARRRRRRETASPEKPLTLSVFIPGGQMAAGSAVFMSLELADNGTAAAASGSNVTTESANMSLTVGVASITPRAWSDLLGGWVDTDAEVAEESSIEKMVFKSNFFGSYSGKMFIAPNTINFATVFNNFAGKLAENFVTLLVLCLIIGIYVVVSVWMWRLDRQEAANLRYEPLEDNEFDNDYTFIISVYTGDESGADTTSNVFINLAGTWGSSGPSQLSDGVRQNFSRGSVCNFAMTTRAPLGELRGLKVWHDNSGKKPGWFLEKILIEDLQTKKK